MTDKLKALKSIIRDKRGALLWELLIVLMILFTVLYSAMTFLGAFIQFETLSYSAKTVARNIEVTGYYKESDILNDISMLTQNSNLRMGTEDHPQWYDIDIGAVPDGTDTELANSLAYQQKIQLRQTFSITLYATYDLHLLGTSEDSFLSSWTIPIPMSYTVTGMSEVYHRE